ncbi:MAG: class II aldolase/adducin family protein [bacterium]
MWQLGLIGQNDKMYDGYGYGNVSVRVGNSFVISGTQTGNEYSLSSDQWVSVTNADISENRIDSEGVIEPSSEALTHALVYQSCPNVTTVLHVHSALIWSHAKALGLSSTGEHAEYGTPEMVKEVARLLQGELSLDHGVFAMLGHLDGIVSYGTTIEQAACALIQMYTQSLETGEHP